jgi:hypothetical protein
LRLGREVTERDKNIEALRTELKELTAQSAKAILVEQEATRQQIAELTKTNAELVAAVAGKS